MFRSIYGLADERFCLLFVIQDIEQCLYVQHIYFHEINKVGHISVFYKLILSLSITFIRYHARTWRYRHNHGKMF